MNATQRTFEDFASLADAIAALTARGFRPQNVRGDHFCHPDRDAAGYWQHADAFVPHNMKIGRVSFWPGNG